jgi:hypothetical protein
MSDVLENFAWHVPKAFCDPLSQCKLEEGDTLLSNNSGVNRWPPSLGTTSIQFLSPIRGTNKTAIPADSEGVFLENWNSEAVVELIVWGDKPVKDTITTTQGRVYSCIWKGDTRLLYPNQRENPNPPLLAKVARSMLRETKGTVSTDLAQLPSELIKSEVLFAWVTDSTSKLYRSKTHDLYQTLKSRIDCVLGFVSADEFLNVTGFAPTVSIAIIGCASEAKQIVHDTVKELFYRPDPKAKNPQFRINSHGTFLR